MSGYQRNFLPALMIHECICFHPLYSQTHDIALITLPDFEVLCIDLQILKDLIDHSVISLLVLDWSHQLEAYVNGTHFQVDLLTI